MTNLSEFKTLRSQDDTWRIGGINPWWIVVLIATIVYGWNFWGPSIYMLDEAKNAGSAAEMIRRNDYLVPTFNGEYHDKPALQYFFMIAGYHLFGVNAFGARFFSVVMGILTSASLYFLTRRILDTRTAFVSSLIYLSSLQLAVQFRMAVPDPYLLFCLTTGWLCFYIGYRESNSKFLFAFYALIGLAFLAKGPIAFALTGLIVLVFLLWERAFRFQTLMKLQLIPGALLTLAIGLPWYVGSGIATGWDWPRYFFLTHNLDRYVNTFEGHGGFPGDVIVIVFAALLPASVLLPQSVVRAVRLQKENSFFTFVLSACIAVPGFFLFSKTVLPSYPAPCMAFASVLLGSYLTGGEPKQIGWLRVSSVVALVLCLVLPIAAWVALSQDELLHDLSGYWILFVPAPVGAALAMWFVFGGKLSQAVYSWTASFVVTLLLVFTWLFPAIDSRNPVYQSMHLVETTDRATAYYRRVNSSYVFYHQQPFQKLETPEQLQEFAKTSGQVMVLSTMQDLEGLDLTGFRIVFRSKDLFETPESVILVND